MGDRRVADRRARPRGVINVKLKDAIIVLVIATVLIISISANIVLGVKYNKYKTYFYEMLETSEYFDVNKTEENPSK